MTCENCGACTYSNEEYQEFIPYKEYAIGEFFKVGNEVFKVILDAGECDNCDLENTDYCNYGETCGVYCRKDGNSVKFILYDTLKDNA